MWVGRYELVAMGWSLCVGRCGSSALSQLLWDCCVLVVLLAAFTPERER